jgi:hypothetical protein
MSRVEAGGLKRGARTGRLSDQSNAASGPRELALASPGNQIFGQKRSLPVSLL